MRGPRLILLITNALVWAGFLIYAAGAETALNYIYVPVAFTAGCLVGLLNIGRLPLAANVVAWAYVVFVLVGGNTFNVLVPVTVLSALAFSLGSATVLASGLSH